MVPSSRKVYIGTSLSVNIRTNDSQLQELNSRFNDDIVKLLMHNQALSPKGCYKSSDVNKILKLVELFCPEDLTNSEKSDLKYELQLY